MPGGGADYLICSSRDVLHPIGVCALLSLRAGQLVIAGNDGRLS